MTVDTNTFVISLGGALVVPDAHIDIEFLSAFNTFIRKQVSEKKRRFFITVGGGAIMRSYRDAATKGGEISDTDLDWLGIHASRLNAQLVRTIFKDIADPRIIKHYEIILKITQPIAIAAGWKPGWSTDYCAVTLCQDYGIKRMINMTNIDKTKPMDVMTWKKYRALAGDTWNPGLNLPFDPIAAKLADEMNLSVKILNGKDLDNLALALDDKPFVGTTIQS